MHHVVSPQDSSTFDERRRHVRHDIRTSSIVIIELGPNNGGILLNLGAGGLSLQAVAKLNPETELTLHFRLEGIEQLVETTGRVAWLGPTQKEAGISFQGVSANTEQLITDWIARQERAGQDTETGSDLHPKSLFKDFDSPALPIQAQSSTPATLLHEKPGNALSGSVAGIPTRPFLTPDGLSTGTEEALPRDSVLVNSSWVFTSGGAIASDRPLSATRESTALESRRRRRNFTIGVVASVVVILAAIVMLSNLNRFLGPNVSVEQPVGPISAPPTIPPANAARTGSAVQTGRGVDTTPSTVAPNQANSAAPIPATHKAVSAPQSRGWIARLKDFLGLGDSTKIDPAMYKVPVWTVQHSGYYYCADNPDFEKLRPGSMMTQIEAIQSGYQPRLGSYCQ